jgi:alpha-galactosidase
MKTRPPNILIPLFAALVGCANGLASAHSPTSGELQDAARWFEAAFQAPSATNPAAGLPPFSFVYDGQTSPALLNGWRLSRLRRQLENRRTEHTLVWTDPATGLAVRCVAIEDQDFPTVEWVVHFRNTGAADTPILSDLRALDIGLERGDKGEFILHHHTGDLCTPDSYAPHQQTLPPKSEQRFAPSGGRPTQGAFPYFDVEWPGQGLLAVIGWPGQWEARFTRDAGRGLRLRAGQELTRLRLRPGEEIRTPLVVLQFWRGDRIRAHNVWRRWMLARNLPRTREGRVPPPILTSCSGGFFPGLKCNEADELRFIDTFSQAGVRLDYWWMDAGWYPCGADWGKVGTWTPDPDRFPRGLKPVSDGARQRGMGLILWFEPERVTPGTWLDVQHPEWLLGRDGGTKLLNLGLPAARQWLTDHVDTLLTKQGISCHRQDFNLDPLPYWRANDSADRQGLTEIRHVEGYLAYWDELRRRHPGLLIDSCASGGRRNDLETLRRAVPLLRSDYQAFNGAPAYAPGNQGHTYGLSWWIPYYGQGAYYSDQQLVYCVRSYWSPAFGFCVDVRKSGTDWALFRRLTEQWREVAGFYLGDFYPLTPYQLDGAGWMAWQFDQPETGQGMVQVFRRDRSDYESARFRLQALEPEARYVVKDLDQPEARQERSGAELMRPGFLVVAPHRPQALVFVYRKL